MFGVYADCTVTMSKTLVWISGNTYPVRDSLKADGFKWSAKKRAWWMSIADYTAHLNPMTDSSDDHAIMGTAADGTPVVVAECKHMFADADNYGFNPWTD